MYDFYLGSEEAIKGDESTYLLSIKRLLPRYLNSLPDQSFKFLDFAIEKYVEKNGPVFVETGIGASTIVFLHYAMKYDGKLLSWDMNALKASELNRLFTETLGGYHGKSVKDYWTFLPAMTTCPYTGTGIAKELTDKVNFSFHDSNHTWDVISHEILSVIGIMDEGSIICVDDANQTAAHTYEPIINITRKKVGLGPIDPIKDNNGVPHYQRLEALYADYFKQSEDIAEDNFQKFKDDIYYSWYSTDRSSMNSVGMERFDDLNKRFVAHQLLGKI